MKRAAWVELNPYYVRDIDLESNGILNICRWRKLLKAGRENNLFGPIVNIPKNGPKATVRDFTRGNSENAASKDALFFFQNTTVCRNIQPFGKLFRQGLQKVYTKSFCGII